MARGLEDRQYLISTGQRDLHDSYLNGTLLAEPLIRTATDGLMVFPQFCIVPPGPSEGVDQPEEFYIGSLKQNRGGYFDTSKSGFPGVIFHSVDGEGVPVAVREIDASMYGLDPSNIA